MVVRFEEEAYAAEAGGGLGRSLTIRKVAELPAGELSRKLSSRETDRTVVAPEIQDHIYSEKPYYEPYYNQEDLDAAGSGASTPARGLMTGHSAVDFASQSREQSRERSLTRNGQHENGRLHYAASMASSNSDFSNVYNNDNVVREVRWI